MFIVFKFFSSLSLSFSPFFFFLSSFSSYSPPVRVIIIWSLIVSCVHGKELLCMDSTAHEMKGLTRDQVLSMHHLTKQLRTFENLPYHVSVNDVSEMIVLIGTNKKST